MTKTEVATMLAMIAAFDHRTIGETDVEAWHLILSNVELEDAMLAVGEHYTESTDWMMPKHVLDRAIAIDYRRRGQERAAAIEAEKRAELEANPPGQIPAGAALALVASLGKPVAPVTKDEIDHERHLAKLAEAKAELDARRGDTA